MYTNLDTMQICAQIYTRTLCTRGHACAYGVATVSRLLKIIGLSCKRALLNRRYAVKETYNFKEPTNRSHPIQTSQTHACTNCIHNVCTYTQCTHRHVYTYIVYTYVYTYIVYTQIYVYSHIVYTQTYVHIPLCTHLFASWYRPFQ